MNAAEVLQQQPEITQLSPASPPQLTALTQAPVAFSRTQEHATRSSRLEEVLARTRVERVGGQLERTSQPGRGAIFRVRIPLQGPTLNKAGAPS